jgi:D-amino peptidase
LVATTAEAQELKVYMSVDMEGITGVVDGSQTGSSGSDYNLARKWMAEDVNAAVKAALEAGAAEIVVNDAHGSKRNIIITDLHPAASLLTGTPKPLSMMQGIEEGADVALFIGYHAKAGTQDGVLDHTISGGTVYSIKINGIEMPELGINALIAGYFDVPVGLVVGDKAVCRQAKEILGDQVVTAEVKEAVGRYAAKNLPLEKAHQLIQERAKLAIDKRSELKPYKLDGPYTFELAFMRSSQADGPMMVPGVERVDARTVRMRSDDFLVGVKFMRALISLAQ